jgi:type IX secretion system PorP/SprF family membrane protein
MKKLVLFATVVLLFAWDETAFCQADISMSTHWYNRASYNPASIARPGYLYVFSNVRRQWTGVSGAPTVFNLQASGFNSDLKSGMGLSLISDQVGLNKVVNPSVIYAYRISGEKEESPAISMGLSFGLFVRSIDGSKFEPDNLYDPSLIYENKTTYRPDANLGFEYQRQHLIFGLSGTHLFAIGKSDSTFMNTSHRYGYLIYLNSDNESYNYSLGGQFTNRHNLTVFEVNGTIRFKHPTGLIKGPSELFDLGLTLRSTRQLTFLAGINLSPNLRMGYIYDYDFDFKSTLNGTHEILLEYRIQTRTRHALNEWNWYY